MGIGSLDIFNAGADLLGKERQIDRDADAADTAWRRGQENMQISNAFSAAEAQKARDWTERLSNTAYQRQVADLRNAGLNPILGISKGAGASTPSSAAASASMASAPNQAPAPDFGKAVTTSLAAKRLEEDIENIRADTELKRQHRLTGSAEYNRILKATDLLNQQYLTERENTEHYKRHSAAGAVEEEIDNTTYGRILRYIDRLRGGSSILRNAR